MFYLNLILPEAKHKNQKAESVCLWKAPSLRALGHIPGQRVDLLAEPGPLSLIKSSKPGQ